jgi:hypothetical protein
MTKIIYTNKGEKILVDDCDYDILNKTTWCFIPSTNSIHGKLNKKSGILRRLIYSEIMGIDIFKKFIGHVNQNKLDHRRENLKIMNRSDGCRNSKIRKNKSSKYRGVHYVKRENQWCASFNNFDIKLSEYFFDEDSAGWQYNLWVKEYNLQEYTNLLNDVEKPINFKHIQKIKRIDKNNPELPSGILKTKYNTFRVRMNNRRNWKSFKTLEEAVEFKNIEKLEKLKIDEQTLRTNQPYIENENGDCILKTKKNEKIIIDKEDYEKLYMFSIHIGNNGYVNILKKGFKMRLLSRFLLDNPKNKFVDHINRNRLDNRKINLRISDSKQNSRNRTKKLNTSSKYIGVIWLPRRCKWISRIKVNEKEKHLGTFNCEIQAAEARDIATKKYFGEYGNLNFPTK